MIQTVKAFFEKHLQHTEDDDSRLQHKLQLACAVLLVEITYADGEVSEQEEDRLRHILKTHFQLTAQETEDLLSLAEAEKHAAIDYYRFTSLLNKHYTQQQKIKLIEYLWQLSFADDQLDKFEEHLIRRLSELLHVPHADFIRSKHRVMAS